MGASSPNSEKAYNAYIIWIDKNVNNKENQNHIFYLKENNFKVGTYDDINLGLKELLNERNYFKNMG